MYQALPEILSITTILELSHFENYFGLTYQMVQISRDYRHYANRLQLMDK